jgi:hypothetical protein
MSNRFDLVISRLPEDSADSLRVFRLFAAFELREAKEILEHVKAHLPCKTLVGVTREKADDLSKQVNAKGGSSHVEPSAFDHAMVIWPRAEKSYDMSFLGVSEK